MCGCIVGDGSLIGAIALVTEGKEIPDRSLVVGAPGKEVRQLTDEKVARLLCNAEHYANNCKRYQRDFKEQENSRTCSSRDRG